MQTYGLQTGIFRCASAKTLAVLNSCNVAFCHRYCAAM